METQCISATAKPAQPPVGWDAAEGLGPGQLEVNVIFTDPQATVVALKTAGSLARDLGAFIRLRAAIAVPYALPPDAPLVSVPFTERLLSDLVCRPELSTFEPNAHLYLCRDQVDTLLRVLRPNSLVVICGRKRWWPTPERRKVRALRSKGHQVIFVGLKRGKKSDLP